jgi:hypothetical protein
MKFFVLVLALLTTPARAQEPGAEPAPAPVDAAVAEADRLWRLRAEGSKGGDARPGPIDAVIAVCRRGIEEDPASIGPRWRLMRALYFKGEHTTGDPEEKKRIFGEGRKVGEETLGLVRKAAARSGRPPANASPAALVPFLKDVPDAAPTFFWAAVDWGKWALVFGKMAAIRQGAAATIRDYAEALVLLDPTYDNAGGYRVLGRLHHQTPSVPLLTGWASRAAALKNLRLAVEKGPKNLINRLYLAEALWDYEPARRGEARRMLETLIAETPDPANLVEDRRAQEDAAALLKTWSKG